MISEYTFECFQDIQRTFDWWKNGNSLLHDDATVWNYLNVLSDFKTPLHEDQIPLWSQARNSKRNRCFVLLVGDDSVLVTYKVINMMKSKFIHVLNIPISLHGIKENAVSVITELRKDKFVRFLHYECFREYYEKSERAETQDNYYIDLDEFIKCRMGNTKWRKKNGVSRFEKRQDLFKCISFDGCIDDAVIDGALKARESWRLLKMESKVTNSSNLTVGGNAKKDTMQNAFKFMLKSNGANSIALVCNGKVFAINVAMILNGYAIGFFLVHSGRLKDDNVDRNVAFHNSDSIVTYFRCKALSDNLIKRYYILGSGGEPGLSAYKMRKCNGHVLRCYIDKNK
jgi:hypothetical protein